MGKAFGTPGPRSIYPEMCDSRSLSRCSLLANALWPRLIVQADDQGRLHGDAQDIRGLCFPKMPRVSVKAVSGALDELAEQASLRRYEAHGEPYVQITDWWQYQGYQRRAYPSRFPPPAGWEDVVYGIGDGTPDTYSAALRRNAAERGETPRAAARATGADARPAGRPVPSRPSPSKPVQGAPRRAAAGRRLNGKHEETTAFDAAMTAKGLDPSAIGAKR